MPPAITLVLALATLGGAKGVTSAIRPEYAAPAWCQQTLPEHFGIGVKSLGSQVRRDVHHVDRVLPVIVNQIGDDQPQVHPNATIRRSSTATRFSTTRTMTLAHTTTMSSKLPIPTSSYYLPAYGPQPPVSEIPDGQIQAPILGTKTTMSIVPVSTISDGQIQAPTSSSFRTTVKAMTASISMSGFRKACKTTGSLSMTLANGILTDSIGRTGYIANNHQIQFDAPPQAGARYTAGWSVCDSHLTLGSNTYFWQCRSGDFYNLYDDLTAAQCDAIHLEVVELVDC